MKPVDSLSVFNGIPTVERSEWILVVKDECSWYDYGVLREIEIWINENPPFELTNPPTLSPTSLLPQCNATSSGTLPFYFTSSLGVFCHEFVVTPQNSSSLNSSVINKLSIRVKLNHNYRGYISKIKKPKPSSICGERDLQGALPYVITPIWILFLTMTVCDVPMGGIAIAASLYRV